MAPCRGPIHKAGSTCTAACAKYSWTVDLPLSMAPCLGPIYKAGPPALQHVQGIAGSVGQSAFHFLWHHSGAHSQSWVHLHCSMCKVQLGVLDNLPSTFYGTMPGAHSQSWVHLHCSMCKVQLDSRPSTFYGTMPGAHSQSWVHLHCVMPEAHTLCLVTS